ncbi:MAG: hypothetical protein HY235_28470 [Acidobacteria bacterium]|nr:hypothetical protein [Acidobacteriota bacterium]
MTDAERQGRKQWILGHEWSGGQALALRVEQWVNDHRPWVDQVRWSQWEGLRRQGEGVRRWEEMHQRLDTWMTDDAKRPVNQRKPARRAWDLPAGSPNEPSLRDALLNEIEQATIPPKSKKWEMLQDCLASQEFNKADQDEIDQYLRVQRARRFLALLLMKIRSLKEEDR